MNPCGALLTGAMLLLAACSPGPSAESVESLVAHSDRLRQVTAACRDHVSSVDPSMCAAAAEAERRRFMGEGKAHYTPQPIQVTPDELGRK